MPTSDIPQAATSAPATVVLSDKKPFGIGGRRECFVHPHEPNKCIKVLRQDERRTVRVKSKKRIVPSWLRREYNNNEHERLILQGIFARLGDRAADHLPRCYGYVATDRGKGLVLDLVRDAEGPIARSLRELISTGHDLEQFRPAFDALAKFLIDHRVLTRALLDHNIAAEHRADGSWRLVIIDGLGDPAWLPFARWIPPIGRAKMRKRVAQAWPRMEAFAATGGVTEELRANSSWGQGFLDHRGD